MNAGLIATADLSENTKRSGSTAVIHVNGVRSKDSISRIMELA